MSDPIVLNMQQGSAEWDEARLGVVTASAIGEVITPAKLELSKQRFKLMHRLLAEWACGYREESFQGTDWTERGKHYEPEARAAFHLATGLEAQEVGFVYRNSDRLAGCSPDWLVGEDAGGEVKCPMASTHIGYLLAGGVPPQYKPQIQFSMWVTGRPAWWFVSYHPDLPIHMQRVEVDDDWQSAIDTHVPHFLTEMLAYREQLEAIGVVPKLQREAA